MRELEHDLHGPVAYAILPIFALANAGISRSGVSIETLVDPVTFGVILGLFVGKPVGILMFVGAAVMFRLIRLPEDTNWLQITGVAFARGIGFTMSLFIAGLAFDHGSGEYFANDRLGILVGSVLSAVFAWLVLQFSLPRVTDTRSAT